jgi:hypothetical protein
LRQNGVRHCHVLEDSIVAGAASAHQQVGRYCGHRSPGSAAEQSFATRPKAVSMPMKLYPLSDHSRCTALFAPLIGALAELVVIGCSDE